MIIFDSIIDINYNSLEKLRVLESNNIKMIENIMNYSTIEKLNCFSKIPLEDEQKLIKKILLNKTLKEIGLNFTEISTKELLELNLINGKINTIILEIGKNNWDVTNFLKKFPNLKILMFRYIFNLESFTYIKNDDDICIDEIYIFSDLNTTISFSFSKIKKISLKILSQDTFSFSLFNKNCNDLFQSLELLNVDFRINPTKNEILNNLSNNI